MSGGTFGCRQFAIFTKNFTEVWVTDWLEDKGRKQEVKPSKFAEKHLWIFTLRDERCLQANNHNWNMDSWKRSNKFWQRSHLIFFSSFFFYLLHGVQNALTILVQRPLCWSWGQMGRRKNPKRSKSKWWYKPQRQTSKQTEKVWKVALATLTETYACTSGWRQDQGTQHTASKAVGLCMHNAASWL